MRSQFSLKFSSERSMPTYQSRWRARAIFAEPSENPLPSSIARQPGLSSIFHRA